MRKSFPLIMVLVVALAIPVFGQLRGPAGPDNSPKVGDMAPDFTLTATTGGKVKLSDFRGKSNVVLAFFPAAFTGG